MLIEYIIMASKHDNIQKFNHTHPVHCYTKPVIHQSQFDHLTTCIITDVIL